MQSILLDACNLEVVTFHMRIDTDNDTRNEGVIPIAIAHDCETRFRRSYHCHHLKFLWSWHREAGRCRKKPTHQNTGPEPETSTSDHGTAPSLIVEKLYSVSLVQNVQLAANAEELEHGECVKYTFLDRLHGLGALGLQCVIGFV
jgi:hypothetical protein